MEKYWIEKPKPAILPPHPENHSDWLLYQGIVCIVTHHKESDRYLNTPIYWEELGQETHIGYATNLWAIYKWRNLNIRYPLFNLWIYKPALVWPNVTPLLIEGSYLNRKLDPQRLLINATFNIGGFIGKQKTQR